jgi:hypothetical protein
MIIIKNKSFFENNYIQMTEYYILIYTTLFKLIININNIKKTQKRPPKTPKKKPYVAIINLMTPKELHIM